MSIAHFGLTTLVALHFVGQTPTQNDKSPNGKSIAPLWNDLAGANATTGYRAILALRHEPEAVTSIAENLPPATALEAAKVERLFLDLNSDKFAVRDRAYGELDGLGALVEPDLRKILEANPSLETRQRVVKLLDKIAGPVTLPSELRQIRAVETLEHMGTKEARALLKRYASGAPASRLTQNARAALDRLSKSPAPGSAIKHVATDLYGDPLPSGAIGRWGTVRFRRDFLGVSAFTFLPDGKSLLTAGGDHQVQVWDTATGQLTHKFRTGPANPGAYSVGGGFVLSPDARRLAVMFTRPNLGNQLPEGEIRVHAFPSGDLIRTFPRDKKASAAAMEFSSDGRLLFSIHAREAVLRIEDVDSGMEVAQRAFPSDIHAGLSLSRDGETIAVACGVNSRKVFLWKWGSKEEPRLLPHKDYGLHEVQFSPDGKLLAGIDNIGKLLVWEVAAGRLLYFQEAPKRGFHYRQKPTFTPDSSTIAVAMHSNRGNDSGNIHLIEAATGKSQGMLEIAGFIAISPDSQTMAVTAGAGVRLFDLATRREREQRAESHASGPRFLAAVSNDSLLASNDGAPLYVWDATTMKLIRKRQVADRGSTAAVSPDGRLLAAVGDDHVIHIWDLHADKELYRLPGYSSMRNRRPLGFLPDGQSLLDFSDNFDLRGRNMKNGKAMFEQPIRPDGAQPPDPDDELARLRMEWLFYSATITPDSKSLIIDKEGSLYLFDARTGKQVAKFGSETGFQSSLAVSPDSKFLLTSSASRQQSGQHLLALIDLATGTHVQRWQLPGNRNGPITYSPDGRMFAAALSEPESEIRIYEKATGNIRGVLRGFRGQVQALTFFPDNRRLASSLSDSTILHWDLASVRDP